LFNTARSYWRSAEYLSEARVKVTHPQSPVTFLLCHAVELYLKAFLRGKGNTLGELRKWGHNVATLAENAKASALSLSPLSSETLSHVTEADVAIESRYIVTGFKTVPTIEALAQVASELDEQVGRALASTGLPIRQQKFDKPRQSIDRDEESQIEQELEELTEQDREILAYLLRHNQRMFECALDGGNARMLISRGIVRTALLPGQVFDSENVPMEVPRNIWTVLKKHRSKFPYKGSDDDGHPWRVHWMLR
jgi:HEPN domain-containing protein